MPRKSNRENRQLPAYCQHKPTGQAFVRLSVDGKRKTVYLGTYNSRESLERYDQVVGDWLARRPAPATTTGPLVRDLAERFLAHFSDRKAKLAAATRLMIEMFGERPVAEFSALQFERLKAAMVERQKWSRAYSNELIWVVKRVFRWGMQRGYVSPDQFVVLNSIEPLGADDAPTRDVQPIDDETVDQTLPALSLELQAMVRFVRLTGCRPGEARLAKVGDVDRENWLLELKQHKTAHKGKVRFVAIPAAARELILPRLLRPADCYLFSAEHEARRPFERRALGRAIDRAVKRINAKRKKEGGEPLPHWHPYQLRHTRAVEVREQYGAEVCQILLGHTKIDMTQHYARLTRDRAAELAKQLG